MTYKWAGRLNQLRKDRGWSVAEYYRRVNDMFPNHPISLPAIRKYLKGKVDKPRGDVLQRLGAPFGKDEIFLRHEIDVQNIAKKSKIPLLTMNELGTLDPTSIRNPAWEGEFVDAEATDVEKGLVAVKLNDDSCIPEIRRGSTVFCELVDDGIVEPGSLVVAKVSGLAEGVCRKYRATDARSRDRFKLIAINPDYPDIEASPEAPVLIFGKVVRVLSNYP